MPWGFAWAGGKHIPNHSTDTPSPWSPHSPRSCSWHRRTLHLANPWDFGRSYLQYQSGRGRLAHRTQGVIRHTGVSAESIFSGLLDPDRPVFQQVPARILQQGEPGSSLSQHPPQLLISSSAKPPTHAQGGCHIFRRCPIPLPTSKAFPQQQTEEICQHHPKHSQAAPGRPKYLRSESNTK